MAVPDIFVFGIAGERLAAQLTGAGPEHDLHQVEDVRIHLATYQEHRHGAQLARDRGDLYNALVEEIDAALNLFFAHVVASRIVDPETRAGAFQELNAALGGG